MHPFRGKPAYPNKIFRSSKSDTTPSTVQKDSQNISHYVQSDLQNIESYITQEAFKQFSFKILKRMTTILALTQNNHSQRKLHTAIKHASEEIFQCHINITTSIDGHVFVGHKPF